MKVLVINCGSSSLKYQLIDMEGERVLCKGLCERIGIEGSKITHKANGGEWEQEVPFPTHTEAFMKVVEMMTSGEGAVVKDKSEISAIGHRVVQGAEFFTKSEIVTDAIIDKIEEITGILNGTTNYILTQMTEYGLNYDTVLKVAQEKGFAEADPTADVEGIDVANKLSILMALAFDKYVPPTEIPTIGITGVTMEAIEAAKKDNCKIKLIAKAKKTDKGIEYSVQPTKLSNDHPLATVSNEFNAVFVTGNAVGELMFYGKGAGALPTGSAVMGDVIEIAKRI